MRWEIDSGGWGVGRRSGVVADERRVMRGDAVEHVTWCAPNCDGGGGQAPTALCALWGPGKHRNFRNTARGHGSMYRTMVGLQRRF